MPTTTRINALVALAAFVALVPPAAAQDAGVCGDGTLSRRPLEVTPTVGALGVTTDAPIVALYTEGYFDPAGPGEPPASLVSLWQCPAGTPCGVGCAAAEGTTVAGRAQTLGDRLFFVADGGLAPRATFGGLVRGLDGAIDMRFCTGAGPDVAPPTLGAFRDATRAPAAPSCRLPEGGHRLGLRFGSAADDGPPGSVEYLLFLTRGAGLDAPVLRDRFRNFAADEVTMTLLLTEAEASAPVCFRAFAVDGVGRLSEASDEQCVDPLASAAFVPICAVRGAGAGAASTGAVPLGLGLLALLALSIRRSPPRVEPSRRAA